MDNPLDTIGRVEGNEYSTACCEICGWADPPENFLFGLCGGCMIGLLVRRGIIRLEEGHIGKMYESFGVRVTDPIGTHTRETELAVDAAHKPTPAGGYGGYGGYNAAPTYAPAPAPAPYTPEYHPDYPEWTESMSTSAEQSWWRKYPMADGGEIFALILRYGVSHYAQLRGKGGAQERLGKRPSMGGAVAMVEEAIDYDPQMSAALDERDDLPW